MKNEQNVEQTQQDMNELIKVRFDKLDAIRAQGREPFGKRFDFTHHTAEIIRDFKEDEEKEVRIAGRLMAVRGHGKASFGHVMDAEGKIQVYFRQDVLGEEMYEHFRMLDIGDIIGITGIVFRTHRGEISVKVTAFELLSKSLRPLPEKWHGLKDVDTRYRQRYVDLIVNPDVQKTFRLRSQILHTMRALLDDRGFLEVETPMMHSIPGGAAARPFITHHNALNIDLYMRIAPELYLKRLIVGGFEKIYELAKVFRNEGIDIRHNPEFTLMELYQAYGNYETVMELTEYLVAGIAERVLGTTKITYEGTEIELKAPWKRISMNDAVKEATGIDFLAFETVEQAREAAKSIHVEFQPGDGIGGILNRAFEEKVEETLIQPTFITGHPVEISPLAKRSPENPMITERFEAFVYGRELANGFSELNDPVDQKGRFLDQVKQREAGDDEAHLMDSDYVTALEYGLPPTGGLGIGIDRLVMFLTDSSSIRDVLFFPQMKPKE
ncbi:MAG: lysine--tRNA ligase [Selenomonadales bacterium]|nr:lysine--tRNA ligase [Selenomonadales bacterium]